MVKIGDLEIGEFPLLLAPMEDVSDRHSVIAKKGGTLYRIYIIEGLIKCI